MDSVELVRLAFVQFDSGRVAKDLVQFEGLLDCWHYGETTKQFSVSAISTSGLGLTVATGVRVGVSV